MLAVDAVVLASVVVVVGFGVLGVVVVVVVVTGTACK